MNIRVVIVIATAAMAALLEIIDSSIVNVALPSMMGNLGVTLDEVSWVSTGYMIANSIVLPIAAWLGMRLGRRAYFTTAILLFTASSFLCGIAPNLVILIVFRIIQGLSGGALLPTSQTLIVEQFPREKAGMASAVFGMSVMIGPTIGPTLGGYLTDNFGWRSIFNINVPLGLIAAFLSSIYVQEPPATAGHSSQASSTQARASIDWVGLILLCVGVGSLQFVLERGEANDWFDSTAICAATMAAVLGIISFVIWELKIPNPIMNLKLFSESIVRSGTVLMMMLGMMLYSLTFIVPIFASTIPKLTATQTGELFIPGAICTSVVMMFVGIALRKVDPRLFVFLGMLLAELCLLQMTHFTTQTGTDDLFSPLLIRGLAMGCLFIPINGMVLGAFRGPALGQVAGMMNFFRQLGGSIGIASLSTLLTRKSAQNYLDVISSLNPLNFNVAEAYNQYQKSFLSGLSQNTGLGLSNDFALKALMGRVSQQVFILSFNQIVWTIMFVFALGLIPLLSAKIDKNQSGPVLDVH